MQSGQNILPIFGIVILFAVVIIFAVWLIRWQFRKADRSLENWANENKCRILEKLPANFGDGPTGTRQSSSQVKYRIIVVDENDVRKSGLATIGSKNLGTLSDEVVVSWDN